MLNASCSDLFSNFLTVSLPLNLFKSVSNNASTRKAENKLIYRRLSNLRDYVFR